MRDIRARISDRNIELTNQQIQELAGRRLEAILDPRNLKPSLMDELRRASGVVADAPAVEPEPVATVDASSLYDASGFVGFMRRLLRPLLNLFFNTDTLAEALASQARINATAAAREAEQRRRQAEWNALHFEILRRLVLDVARADIDTQSLALRVESLAARVDFNERRVRGLEQTQHQAKPSGRPVDPPQAPPSLAPPREREEPGSPAAPSGEALTASAEGTRRRRRRRRGRKPGAGQPGDLAALALAGGSAVLDQAEPSAEGEEFEDDLIEVVVEETAASEVAVLPVEPIDSPEPAPQSAPVPLPPEPVYEAQETLSDPSPVQEDDNSGPLPNPEPPPEGH